MKINSGEFENTYGIKLPKGMYECQINGDELYVSLIKDDTEGCVLPGENKVVGKVINSRHYEKLIIQKIKKAGGEILLTIE
jgi:hypothetical protein